MSSVSATRILIMPICYYHWRTQRGVFWNSTHIKSWFFALRVCTKMLSKLCSYTH